MSLRIIENEQLSRYTTFKIGGPARFFITVKDEKELREALAFAQEKKLDHLILGGGSNLLVADQGFDGVAIKILFNDFKIGQRAADYKSFWFFYRARNFKIICFSIIFSHIRIYHLHFF